MKNNLAERLERVLMIDKSVEPQRIVSSLKADLRDVIRQYAELVDDVAVNINEIDGYYELVLVASIVRFKL